MNGLGGGRLSPIEASIKAFPQTSIIGEPVTVTARGLEPGREVELSVECRGAWGADWASRAVFTADDTGTVDVSRRSPVEGGYEGVDPSGLFWSMRPSGGLHADSLAGESTEPIVLRLSAAVRGVTVAETTITRVFRVEGVGRLPVRDNGLVGTLFTPAEDEGRASRPAVVVLGGSDGGIKEGIAAVLASHGFAALALAYFGLPGLPPALEGVPVEYVQDAIGWLESRPEVRGRRIGLLGASRGGELALLVSSIDRRVKAVAGYSASGVVLESVWFGSRVPSSPWSRDGRPVGFLRLNRDRVLDVMLRRESGEAASFAPIIEEALTDSDAVRKASIPVEEGRAAVLLLSGGRDNVWPAARLSRVAMDRLRESGYPEEYGHLNYDLAGHVIGLPYVPTTVDWYMLPRGDERIPGPDPGASAAASIDSWPLVKAFLARHLGG